ncbi:MAG: DUF6465 family protein [Lachnospiraceae bacterium]|nr:DUF6465 family protein [Lachnospiraceae bacterium]
MLGSEKKQTVTAAAATTDATAKAEVAKKDTSAQKKATAKKATTAKKTTTAKKAATAKKSTKKNTAAKGGRKPSAKSLLSKASVVYNIEFHDRGVTADSVAEKAIQDYMAKTGNREVKNLELFIQPKNEVAYYTVDGQGGDDFCVSI